MSDFFWKHGLILPEVLWYMEREEESRKKYPPHNCANKFIFLRGFDHRQTFFWISRNLIGKGCFQRTLNAGQSPMDSLEKIKKPIIIELNFEKISKTVKNLTAKPWIFSLYKIYEKRLETLLVYIKEPLTIFKVLNVSSCCHNLIFQV